MTVSAFDASSLSSEKNVESQKKPTDNQIAKTAPDQQVGAGVLTPRTGLEKPPTTLNTDNSSLYASVHVDPKSDSTSPSAIKPAAKSDSFQAPGLLPVQEGTYHDPVNAHLDTLNKALQSGDQNKIDAALKPVQQDANWWLKPQSGLNTDVQKNLAQSMKALESGDKNAFVAVQKDLVALQGEYWEAHHTDAKGGGSGGTGGGKGHTTGGTGDNGGGTGAKGGSGGGDGGSGGTGSGGGPGETAYDNLQNGNLSQDTIASEVGGQGGAQISLSKNPDGSLEYNSSNVDYSNSLIANHLPSGSQNSEYYQMSVDLNLKSNPQNTQAYEIDSVLTYKNSQGQTVQDVVGTQVKPDGEVDGWNQQAYQEGKGGWYKIGQISPLQAGENNIVIDFKATPAGDTYLSYTDNGQSANVNPNQATNTSNAIHNWAVGDDAQIQLDGTAHPGDIQTSITNWDIVGSDQPFA